MTDTNNKQSQESRPEDSRVSIYLAWCKRCGNCVAFCPTEALETDEWGYPYLAEPEKCTGCHLCEKLCPDFAISVGPQPPGRLAEPVTPGPPADRPTSEEYRQHSPERLASASDVDREEQNPDHDR